MLFDGTTNKRIIFIEFFLDSLLPLPLALYFHFFVDKIGVPLTTIDTNKRWKYNNHMRYSLKECHVSVSTVQIKRGSNTGYVLKVTKNQYLKLQSNNVSVWLEWEREGEKHTTTLCVCVCYLWNVNGVYLICTVLIFQSLFERHHSLHVYFLLKRKSTNTHSDSFAGGLGGFLFGGLFTRERVKKIKIDAMIDGCYYFIIYKIDVRMVRRNTVYGEA